MSTPFRSLQRAMTALLLLTLAVGAGTACADPPSRVARLSVVSGDVNFAPAGDDNWYAADLNRPLVSGDRLYTDRAARAELDLGAVSVRLDEDSGFSILDLDDSTAQLELTQGTLNLHVHKLYSDQRYEVDTPTLAFVISQPGEYRIDIGSRGNATRLTVFDGAGEVFGAGGTRYHVEQRQTYRFNDSRLRDVAIEDPPRPDDFDNWCFARDDRYENSVVHRYVSDEVIGADDLEDYGTWDDTPEYGTLWYPTRVANGWAPYRDGHWAWIDPWGWTWVDNAPWGFAPFHYGRWVYVGNRWAWLPGPVELRPVYAPALVVFIGGGNWGGAYARGGAPVGWCPLGPRDVYRPPYSVSHGYYTHVNDSNSPLIDHDHLSSSYENYARHRPERDHDYAYRHDADAVTAVSRETFVQGHPVAAGRLHLKDEQLAHAEAGHETVPSPTTSSALPATDRVHPRVPREDFHRDVIAHRAPPPPAAPFAARLRAIERNGGRPLDESELRQLNAGHADAAQQRVQVVAPAATDTQVPPSQESQSRARPLPSEQHRVPSARFAPSREVERNADQGAVDRAPRYPRSGPVEQGAMNDAPATGPDTVRSEERRSAPVREFVRERRREIPVQVEQHDAAPASAPAVDNTVRPLNRQTRHEPDEAAPSPRDLPQASPVVPVPRIEQRPAERPAPHEHHPSRRNEPPPSPEREAEQVHAQRPQNARRHAEDNARESDAPGR